MSGTGQLPGAAADPDDPAAAVRRAELLCQLDRPLEAVAALRRGLASHPGHPGLWRQLAYAYVQLDHPDTGGGAGTPGGASYAEQARAAAARSLELAPEHEWGHRLLSVALGRLGRHDQAVRAAGEAARLDPDNWRTSVRLAHALLAAGDHGRARAAGEQAVRLAPNEPETHGTLGTLALAGGELGRAEAAWRYVLRLDPDNARAIHNLALVDRARGRLGRAAGRFGAAVASDPRRHHSAAAVEESLLELVHRILLFGCLTPALLTFLGATGRSSDDDRYRLFAPLLAMSPVIVAGVGTLAYRQIPRHLRRYTVRLVWRRPLLVACTALALVSHLAILYWAFAAWDAGSPWEVYWVLLPALALALPLLSVERRRKPRL